MQNICFIGIDVSKKKLDICVLSKSKVVKEIQEANHQQAIIVMLNELKEEFEMTNEDFIICAEYTGQYTYPLSCACASIGCTLWLENPTQIKYSCGMTRGKNDRVDARRIADRLRANKRPTEELERLKQLESERTLYLTDITKYKTQLSDQKDYMPEGVYKRKAMRMKVLIASLEQSIKAIEEEMDDIIEGSEELSRQMELLKSIDGVGRVVALNMIITTEAFSRFDNARQFCCYAGLAPFAYTSGSSQHSKNRVSKRAAKYIKALLHMAAIAIAHRKGGGT